jgi:predicted transcriptional regulator
VPPTVNRALVEFVRATGDTTSPAVAEHFDMSVQNAVNHLTKLTALGLLQRRAVPPKRGGKRFVWTAAR